MTKQQHKNRTKTIKDVAEKNKARAAEQKQMEAEAEALEKSGKWDEATVAWAAVADYATGKAKARAAGHQAAAKTRASAASKALEEQMDAQMEADEAAKANRYEIERKDREQRALEEEQAEAKALEEKQNADETRACTPEEMAAEAAGQQEKEPKAKKEPKVKAPRERDPRLPPVGTVIVKTDRNGTERVRCVITEAGIEYGGATYKTISAAAMAAAKDLGLASKSQDGYAFWGLKKPAPKPVSEEVLAEARATFADAATRYGALAEQYPDPLPAGGEIDADTATRIEQLITELRAIAAGLDAAKKLVK